MTDLSMRLHTIKLEQKLIPCGLIKDVWNAVNHSGELVFLMSKKWCLMSVNGQLNIDKLIEILVLFFWMLLNKLPNCFTFNFSG